MKKVFLLIFLASIFLLRPYQLEREHLIYGSHGGDDLGYLAHSAALAFGEFPRYAGEHYVDGNLPKYTIGPALLALPFVFAFSRIDVLAHDPAITDRDAPFLSTWAVFGFEVATVFYFCLSALLCWRLLSCFYSERAATWSTALLYVAQGFPLYAYRRPVFSHIYELFAQTLLLTLLLSITPAARVLRSGFLGGISGALVTLTRYNNLFMSLWFPVVTAIRARWNIGTAAKAAGAFLATFGALLLVFKIWPTFYSPVEHYNVAAEIHFELLSFKYLGYRFIKLLVGWDWGLLWTAPFTLLGTVWLYWKNRDRDVALLSAPLLVNLIITLLFASQGGWYGYRYLLFALTPFSAFGLAGFLDRFAEYRSVRAALMLFSVFPVASMLCFEGNPEGLTLHIVQQDGRSDWGNNTYQLEVWKALVHPKEFAQATLKGIPAYVAVMGLNVLGQRERVPAKLSEKYPQGFVLLTLERVLILLAVPCLFCLWKPLTLRESL